MSGIVVGQECWATGDSYGRRAEPRKVVVEKIGRLYITTRGVMEDGTVQGDWTRRRFSIETRGEHTRFGSGGRLYTFEEWDEREECDTLRKRLSDLGLTTTYRSGTAFDLASAAQLRAIVEILEGPK